MRTIALFPDDFTIDRFEWLVQIEATHRQAGFPPICRETLARRFYDYLDFLKQKGFIEQPLLESITDVTEAMELRRCHLSDEGFAFVCYSHDKWLNRTYKDKGDVRERAFLEKWYQKMEAQQPAVS